ncbi:hypothetical protein [Microseira sp. BLCC-F43]|uniref:hypothetical protein n=1 Tax=Microseira sp. BLCC-F43 TaxID=3153602 RepID=UPI0035BA4C86
MLIVRPSGSPQRAKEKPTWIDWRSRQQQYPRLGSFVISFTRPTGALRLLAKRDRPNPKIPVFLTRFM